MLLLLGTWVMQCNKNWNKQILYSLTFEELFVDVTVSKMGQFLSHIWTPLHPQPIHQKSVNQVFVYSNFCCIASAMYPIVTTPILIMIGITDLL